MSSLLKKICFAWLLAFASVTIWSASAPKDDKPPIPDDLFFEFKPIPDSENTIINWRRAAAVEVDLDEAQKKIISYCWKPEVREPSADDLDSLQVWLKRNQEALELFNASLQKPKAQWPERDPQNVQPEIKAFSQLIRARLFEADQLAEQKKFGEAAKVLEGNLKLAQRAIDGDAMFIHYMLACSGRTLTQEAILRLASRKQAPVAELKELLQSLPALDSETNAYDHILRVEFTCDYKNSLDLKKLAGNWSKALATNNLLLNYFPDDLQRAARVLLDPSLVSLHPKPFDAVADIEQSIKHYRIYRTNSLVSWDERDGNVELDEEENQKNLAQDIIPLMELVKDEPLPLSRQAAQKARAAYLKIENPVGRIFDTSIIHFMLSDVKVRQARTEREAIRAVLALLIFEWQKEQLPATLSDLVSENFLSSVPVDPFCGKSLHYSREKRKVWSVSDNGVDDNGEAGNSRWYQKDAVWQIPELK